LLEAQSTNSQLLQIDLSNLEWNSMAKKIDDAIAEK